MLIFRVKRCLLGGPLSLVFYFLPTFTASDETLICFTGFCLMPDLGELSAELTGEFTLLTGILLGMSLFLCGCIVIF